MPATLDLLNIQRPHSAGRYVVESFLNLCPQTFHRGLVLVVEIERSLDEFMGRVECSAFQLPANQFLGVLR